MSTITKSVRIASIDVFRAFTMFLMIFVNDLWSIKGIPHWMEHAALDEDMLGLSDVVFPSFLFILGMSIPLALERRIKKGELKVNILGHVVVRSLALLVMGLFSVNSGSGLAESVGISKPVFSLIMLVCFFLIWNSYPKTDNKLRDRIYQIMKIVAAVILVILIFMYRDPFGGYFQPRWWGILGLIGWTYLLCASIYLYFRKSLTALITASLLFVTLCIAGSNGLLGIFNEIIPGNGCFHAFTMFGLLLSLLFNRKIEINVNKKLVYSVLIGIVFIIAGWCTNKWWIISKLQATPPWLFYCSGISTLFYIFTFWLADLKNKSNWFDIIKPAGNATLTCYLVPSFLYAIFTLIALKLPGFMTTGLIGILKCIMFSFLVIGITATLGKINVKLKI